MISIFNLVYPPNPCKGAPGRGAWGARGGIPPKIKFYVNFGVFNSGDFKNDLYFYLRVLLTPAGCPWGRDRGPREEGLVLY